MAEQHHGFETRAIHAGQAPDPTTGALTTPLHMTSTFAQSSPGEHRGYEYSRSANPTRSAYEACLASLEGGRRGLACASGMAATTTVMGLLKSGDHVLACDDLYGGTRRLFEQVLTGYGIEFDYADLTDADVIGRHLKPNTRMLWLESPTNPLLQLLDISALAARAHQRDVLVVVDNTFMSPYLQRPLELGADISLHSTTKYVSGHSDLVGGAIIAANSAVGDRLAYLANAMGGVQSTFDAWLCMRSLKTLAVRMEAHERNAMRIARYLEAHAAVQRVIYPGLASHPQHALAVRQMHGFGGMLSFYLAGDLAMTTRFLERVRLFTLAESLGGVESLIEHPAIMTHASVPAEVRTALGIGDNLVRLSVGIETCDDLLADLEQALAGD